MINISISSYLPETVHSRRDARLSHLMVWRTLINLVKIRWYPLGGLDPQADRRLVAFLDD